MILNTALECLHLKSLSISRSVLEWILTNCHNLQRLSLLSCVAIPIIAAYSKHQQKHVIFSLKLRHSKLFRSFKAVNVDALDLYAPQLTSFTCYEFKFDVKFHNVPSLADITLRDLYLHFLNALSGFSSQLKQLSFSLTKVS